LCVVNRGGPRALPGRRQLLHTVEVAYGRAPTTGGLRGQAVAPVWGAGGNLRRPRRFMQDVGLRDRQLGTQSFFCQVLTQARIPHEREVNVAGNGRRQADVLPRSWDGRRDLAVDLTIVHLNPANGRPLRGIAATLRKEKGK